MMGMIDKRKNGEKCQSCGKRYQTIYKLFPNYLWEKITNIKDGSGLLCQECINKKAQEKNISLYWIATEGEYII